MELLYVIDFSIIFCNQIGENPLTLTEAFLYKIQETSDINNPFYGSRGDLNLINVLFDFFLAGSDTTAVTLDWAMLLMILNPGIQTKVRQDIVAQGASKLQHLKVFASIFLYMKGRAKNLRCGNSIDQ